MKEKGWNQALYFRRLPRARMFPWKMSVKTKGWHSLHFASVLVDKRCISAIDVWQQSHSFTTAQLAFQGVWKCCVLSFLIFFLSILRKYQYKKLNMQQYFNIGSDAWKSIIKAFHWSKEVKILRPAAKVSPRTMLKLLKMYSRKLIRVLQVTLLRFWGFLIVEKSDYMLLIKAQGSGLVPCSIIGKTNNNLSLWSDSCWLHYLRFPLLRISIRLC